MHDAADHLAETFSGRAYARATGHAGPVRADAADLLDRLCRDFAEPAGALLRREVACQPLQPYTDALAKWLRRTERIRCAWRLLQAPPVWVALAPANAFALLEMLLGGSGESTYLPRRAFTDLETRLLGRLVNRLGEVIRSSWPQGGLSALHAEPASSADPPEAAVGILPIELRTGSTSLRLEVGLSEDLLEPLASPRQAPPDRRSPVVDLTAAVEGIDLTARELRQLAPGDIVATEAKPDDEVILRVAGIPKYAGRLGSLNGHRAVTITRTLDSSDPPRS